MRWFPWLSLFAAAPVAAQTPVLLPSPTAITTQQGGFDFSPAVAIVANERGGRTAAARLTELLASQRLRVGAILGRSGTAKTIRFMRAPGFAAESYRLVTSNSGATISASDDAGLLYGAVTLWQLAAQPTRVGHVAAVTIDDRPRYGWRGLMLDSARHFQSPAYIRHLIDWMMASKLNRLHWHLVDDQGWRLPVPGWPRLTGVSAWRRGATAPGAPPLPVEGGFYTEAQIKQIVAYAAARGVTIVPEIEMPGHALSAIRAYPRLGMGVPIPPGAESDYGVFPWLYNTNDATFDFLEAVLGQTMKLFPSHWIHVGGDEAVKDQWRASPAIQAKIKALRLKDEDALQGWFMSRIGRFLAAHGRRLVGWDEILDGAVPGDATITSWRGVDGAIKAAKTGHDAILSPAPTLYLNNRQGFGPEEPPSHGALVTLADVLAFDPMPKGLSPDQQRHILGLQGNLFTEHVRTDDRAAWMTFPRGFAVAEIGWAGRTGGVQAFAAPLMAHLMRLKPLGLNAADSAFAVAAQLDAKAGAATTTLTTQAAFPTRYTLDGTVPGPSSALYGSPLAVSYGTRLRATSFLGDQPLPGGYDRVISRAAVLTRTSRELNSCSQAVPLDLEDDYPAKGPRAHFFMDVFHPCWRWDAAPRGAAHAVAITVGQIPFNFQVGDDRAKIRFRPPATPAGEFEVREGGCEGQLIATLPLAPAIANPGLTRLRAPLPPSSQQSDLCFTYTARGVNPLWAIDRVELLP